MEFMSSATIFMMLLGTGRSSDPLTLAGGTGNFSELFQNSCARSGCKNYTDSTVRSCSQKCSCQPNCHEVGTCCPDMPGIDDLKPKYECKDLSEFYYKNPDHVSSVTGVYFRVVDDCPNGTMSKEYPRCVNATYLDDFIITNCRPIFCQLGTIPAGKRCLPVFQDVHGVAVSLYVIFSVPPGCLSHTQNISHLVDSILQGLISQNGASCGLCERVFRNINGSRSEMLMEFSVLTTSMCTVSHILKMARYLLSQGTIGFQMQLNNDTFDIWFKLSTQEIDRDYQIDGILEGYQCKSRKQIVDWMFLDCPHFRLRSDSLETLGLGNIVQKTLLHKMVMTKIYNSSDIAICINDYFSARLLNSAKKNYIANGLSLLTYLLAYLL